MSSCSNRFNCKTLAFLLLGLLTIIFFIFFIVEVTTPAPTLGGIQVEEVGGAGTAIPVGGNVIFDTTLNTQSDNIVYNSATGEFTITQPGNYYIDWWVATDGAGASTTVDFTLEVNGVPYSTASSPIVTGQLSGEALVTVTTVPTTITLVNTTTAPVVLAATPVQADLVILELNS